jgi:hypothetical protein
MTIGEVLLLVGAIVCWAGAMLLWERSVARRVKNKSRQNKVKEG